MFFLLDANVATDLGGRQFAFEPYDYGPYDRTVYSELEILARQGLVNIEAAYGAARRKYSLTASGYDVGQRTLGQLNPRAREYFQRVSAWVRSLGFAELVGAIYQQYPDMKVNSVFRD
jgi:DNA-binding PadR family transcriptional regulator